MPIQLECPGCKASLSVPDELAGKAGKCIHCGQRVVVPGVEGKSIGGSGMLFESTPEAMVRELSRRQDSAMLLVFRPAEENGSYDLTEVADSEIKCIVTEDIDAARFAQLIGSIEKRFASRKKKAATIAPREQPFELKGDRLGMSLDEFKSKYARDAEGTSAKLPLSSDAAWGPNKASLCCEPWHRDAGIVHARIDLPAEDNSPSVAGVKTDLLLYHFVDGKLFRITAIFPTDQFHVVSEAAVKKYGPVLREIQKPRQLVWENAVSEIVLLRGSVHPPVPSELHVVHKELLVEAESRMPHGVEDI
ncbi:MAG: hypothetical protein L0Z07_03075 [Planctomycetes bacterium]|nr:hypothetical protein [Planctomycetota bacterium]